MALKTVQARTRIPPKQEPLTICGAYDISLFLGKMVDFSAISLDSRFHFWLNTFKVLILEGTTNNNILKYSSSEIAPSSHIHTAIDRCREYI